MRFADPQRERLGGAFYSGLPAQARPPAPAFDKVAVGPRQAMDMLPRKYSECLEHNQQLKLCCRHIENITAQMYKTHPELAAPDLLVATCAVCGCNHYRLAVR